MPSTKPSPVPVISALSKRSCTDPHIVECLSLTARKVRLRSLLHLQTLALLPEVGQDIELAKISQRLRSRLSLDVSTA